MLVIIIGRSGAGKTTFIEAMNCPQNHFSLSAAVEKQLVESGLPVNHDTLQPILHKLYTANHYWQIPAILEALDAKKFLVIDGPRSLPEVERLRELCPNSIIIKIEAGPSARNERLGHRDQTDAEAFARIEYDESCVTGLEKIMTMADVTIENNGSLERLQAIARKLRSLLG